MSAAVGLHDFGRDYYVADPCDAPSLTAADIRTILTYSPAHMAARHPRLSKWPDLIKPPAQDEHLGAVVKKLVLNRGHEVRMLPFDNFTTKVAQAQRNQARADGQIVVTAAVYGHASMIAEIAKAELKRYLSHGSSNVTMVWKRQTSHGDIWCRAWLDHCAAGRILSIDTVPRCGPVGEIAKRVANDGVDVEAAWVLGGAPGVEFLTVTIEIEPPFGVTVLPLGSLWIAGVTREIAPAVEVFAAGLATSEWPSAKVDAGTLDTPPWWREEQLWAAIDPATGGLPLTRI